MSKELPKWDPNYPRIGPGDVDWERVQWYKAQGLSICDSINHNDGCTNQDCPVWGIEAMKKKPLNPSKG